LVDAGKFSLHILDMRRIKKLNHFLKRNGILVEFAVVAKSFEVTGDKLEMRHPVDNGDLEL